MFASHQGWHVVEVYEDVVSGAKASRPGLNRLIADSQRGKSIVFCMDAHTGGLPEQHQNTGGHGIRFIAVTQGLDTDQKNPASRSLLHILGAAAEFERELIRERTQAGQARYRQDFESGKVGKTVYSRPEPNLPPPRPRRVFDRDEVLRLRRQGWSYRQIAKDLGLGLGTVVRTLQPCSKGS